VHVELEVRGGGGGGGGKRHGDKYQLELHGTKLSFGHGVIRERMKDKGAFYLNRGTQHVLI